MADKTSSPIFKQKGLVMWLLGLTIVYQMVYQIFVWRALHQEEAAASDEWCASHPGAASPSSPRCLEAQLFRSWQRAAAGAAPAWQALDSDRASSVEDMTTPPSTGTWNASAAVPAGSPSSRATPPTTTGAGVSAAAATAPTTVAAEASTSAPSPRAASEEAQSTSWSPMTAWARGLVDLQRRMEAKMWALPSTQRRRREELFEKLDGLADNITASLAKGGDNTYWSQELAQLQERVEAHKAARRATRASSKEAQHQQQKTKEDSLLSRITAFHRELCQEPFRVNYTACRAFLPTRGASVAAESRANDAKELLNRTAALEADLAAIAAESSAWQKSFEVRVVQTHKELCEEPQRRHRPDCVEFLAALEAQERQAAEARRAERAARRARGAELRANITRETKEAAAALDAKLAEIASGHQAWEKELLERYGLAHDAASDGVDVDAAGVAEAETVGVVAEDKAEVPLPQGPKEMHWSAVTAWASRPQKTQRLRGGVDRDRGVPAVAGRSDLRRSHWAGMIPMVACITAIKSGAAAEIQLKYFIENFWLQTYEGPMQLVLVYHYTDLAAASLVASYADGSYIKGVAARGEGDFPSTTALRFGAWSSDADVIVPWKFDEWHDPQRLSLQVRALAYSSRPACIMRRPQRQQEQERHRSDDDSESEDQREEAQDEPWDETLVGEAAWMWEHWHPLLAEQHAVLLGAEAHHLVELDMEASSGAHGSPAEDLP